MQKLLLFIVFLLTYSFCNAQSADTTSNNVFLTAYTYWKKGAQKTYIIEDKKYYYYNDSLIKEETVTKSEYEVKVIDSTATDYKIRWHISKSLKSLNDNFPKEALNLLSEKYQDCDLYYTISTDGELIGFNNRPHIDSILNDTKLTLYPYVNKMFKDKGITMSEEKLAEFMDSILGKDIFFNLMYANKVSNFHCFYKRPISLLDTVTTEVSFPTRTNVSIPASSSIYISYTDSTTNQVAFVVEQLADTDFFTNYVKNNVQDNMTNFGKDLPRKQRKMVKKNAEITSKLLEGAKVDWWQRLTSVVNYGTGWPQSIVFVKNIITTDKDGNIDERVEETTYELQE
jgi:hypothetical protein